MHVIIGGLTLYVTVMAAHVVWMRYVTETNQGQPFGYSVISAVIDTTVISVFLVGMVIGMGFLVGVL
jgi:hypothetical protein